MCGGPRRGVVVSFHVLRTKGGHRTVRMRTLGDALIMISGLPRLILSVYSAGKKSVHLHLLCFALRCVAVSFITVIMEFISCLSHTSIYILFFINPQPTYPLGDGVIFRIF